MHRAISIILFVLLPNLGFAQGGKDYGEFAPPDAYLNGAEHAYYGSENEWSRRMFSERATNRFYKRRGQRQLLAILDGHPDRAVELCHRRLQADPGDAESLFVLTIAWCQLDSLEQAVATMNRALRAGLPFERFLAGPRDLLRPLAATEAFRTLVAKHALKLVHGPLLGAVTDRRARFWVRTADERAVQIRVVAKERASVSVRSAPVHTSAERDYTGIAEVSGLQPNTEYAYDVLVDGTSAFGEALPSFRTFPVRGHPARFEVGFGGGAGYTPQHERIWDVIAGHHLSAFLLLGDNVYVDLPQQPGAFHDYTYYRRQSSPPFRRLVRSTPIFAIWDDHDAAIDDVWMGPYRDKPAWKLPMLAHFRRQWNNPAYGDQDWPGCWFRFSIGDVDFFMLDGRMYRTNPFAGDPTMLGPAQKAWLFDELKTSQATFKVIVSPVPWASGAKPGSKDTWDGFAAEREEIFAFLETNHIDGVILLSADRHRSEAWRIEREKGVPLYEFLSSKLTNIHTHEIVPGALFSYNAKCSFGVLAFDTTKADAQVTFKVFSIDDELIETFGIKRSQLLGKPEGKE